MLLLLSLRILGILFQFKFQAKSIIKRRVKTSHGTAIQVKDATGRTFQQKKLF